MNIEKIQRENEKRVNLMTNNLDKDSFHTWKSNPVTKLFFEDMQLIMLDKMINIATNQPIDQQAIIIQAKERGYINCMSDFTEWNPFEEDE